MRLITITSLLGFALATPTPADLAPRCGTTLQPSILQQIKQSSPSLVSPNSQSIAVSQSFSSGTAFNRVHQIVGFTNIPPNAYGCTLNVKFPPSYTITNTGYPTLNISTLYVNTPAQIKKPNTWSWNTFFTPSGLSPAVGTGLFGTTQFAQGQQATINSQGCPSGGGGMAFMFEIAGWVWGSASVAYNQQTGAGVYLTYNC